MRLAFAIVLILTLASCGNPPAPKAVTEHMGPGVVRTVEYWKRGASLVIETPDHKVRGFLPLCEERVPAWQGMSFADMVFQFNDEWHCYHIIDFTRGTK
jgi:hypothetical protein